MNTYTVFYTRQDGTKAQADVSAVDPVKALDHVMAKLKPRERTKITLRNERGACVTFRAFSGGAPKDAAKAPRKRRKRRREPAPVLELRPAPEAPQRAHKPRTRPFTPPPPDATRAQLDAFLQALTNGGA